ncbi:hypothetical protein ACFE04_023938 [Oxalis oulophora]
MENPVSSSSAEKICIHLISCAFQRCRVSEDLCRLSVTLKLTSSSIPPSITISISDTGIGSCLEEFQELNYPGVSLGTETWDQLFDVYLFAADGQLSVTTTGIGDDEIYRYHINMRESISTRRLTRLPSNPKNGANGTEVCLSVCANVDPLLAEINRLFQKLLILKIPNVVIELVVEQEGIPGSRCKNIFLANDRSLLPFSASNVERFHSGFEDYVLSHGNTLNKKCDSCFPSCEPLKIGQGVACNTETRKSTGVVVEAVIITSELSETSSSCFKKCNTQTEVLYFRDFSLSSISQSSLNALRGVNWKKYGLTIASIMDRGGCALLEWENLPASLHIDMDMIPLPSKQKIQSEKNLTKKAVKLALDDLKEKYAGTLLSARAHKTCGYASDLAKTLAGLILSSDDSDFQEECISLLGLQQTEEIEEETVHDCIKKRIISVVEMNDRNPQRSKEVASFLFEDERFRETQYEFEEEEYDGENEVFSMDM